jgi:hypothetical protein
MRSSGAGVFLVTGLSRPATVRALVRLIRDCAPDLVHTTLFEAGHHRPAGGRAPPGGEPDDATYGARRQRGSASLAA